MGADDYVLKSLNTGHIDKANKQGTKTNKHKTELKRVSDPSSCHPEYIPILPLNHNSNACQLQMAGISAHLSTWKAKISTESNVMEL